MAAYIGFEHFVEFLSQGKLNLSLPADGGDQLKIALIAAADAPVAATDEDYADLTPVDLTNIVSDEVTITGSSQTGGTFTLTLDTFSIEASSGTIGPFRYIVLYDSTPALPANQYLLCYFDYGEDLTLQSGESLSLDWDVDGLLTIGACPA